MVLSLVVPCYNEEDNVVAFFNSVKTAFAPAGDGFEYEIVFVNDGSTDGTMVRLRQLCEQKDVRVKIINLSRNFGKEAAMYAGLKATTSDFVAIIDADLQQSPELVLTMLEKLQGDDDLDCVAAYQEVRHDSKLLTSFKNSFYKLINKMSDIELKQGASDFRTMRRRMVDAVLEMKEYNRFSKGIFSWIGFRTHYMPYIANERLNGKSKWSLWQLIKYAFDGIVAFSTTPLRVATGVGAFCAFGAIIYMLFVIIQKLFFSIDVPGYATIVVLILFLGGVQLLALGIIGEYIARTYLEVKNRPIYITKETLDNIGDE